MAITIDEFEVSGTPAPPPAEHATAPGAEHTDRLAALRQLQQQITALREQAARLHAD